MSVAEGSQSASRVNRLDVQFWAPPGFSALLSDEGAGWETRELMGAFEGVVRYTVEQVGRQVSALCSPRTSEVIVAAVHVSSEHQPRYWCHHHVVVTGTEDILDISSLRTLLEPTIGGAYLRRLRALTGPLGIVWGRPRPGAPYDVADPERPERHFIGAGRRCDVIDATARIGRPSDRLAELLRREQQWVIAGSRYERRRGSL